MKKHIHVVGAIISNEAGQILCALRSASMSLPNLWEFPGGKIEQGEQPEETLAREIEEELACKIKVYDEVETTIHDYGNFVIKLRTYRAKIISGQPVASEHAALLWLPKESLMSLNWAPADIPAVEKLMAVELSPVSA